MSRRIGWLVGAPLATFRFLTRDTAIVLERERGEPTTAAAGADDGSRPDAEGLGPVLHRIYSATADRPKITAEQLLDVIAADLNVIAPTEVLRFERSDGRTGALREGHELRIRMAGPWDGPVRVSHRDARTLRLSAIEGNAMLGQMELRVASGEGGIALEVHTSERAARRTFRVLQRVGVTGLMQLHTWAAMLENAAQVAGARRPERVTVRAWRADGSAEPQPLSSAYEG